MKMPWKIFRIANIVEIILVGATLSMALFRGKFSVYNGEDVLGLSILVIVSATFVANAVNNILLRSFLQPETDFRLSRKIFFWCLSVLSLLFSSAIVLAIASAYPELTRPNGIYKPISKQLLIGLAWMLIIGMTGLFIFVMQVILFKKIQKHKREMSMGLLSSIGETGAL